ncbi:MAG: TlyA family RNA methyltransferase [Pseudomonadota bacterium]
MATERLDQKMVTRGLAPSRARAQALIGAEAVRVDGAIAAKASLKVGEDAKIEVVGDPCPWVSRAGAKLAHAIEVFKVSPRAAVVADIGASTGGFTEVCLSHAATRVYAVDVGRDQLHPTLQNAPQVIELSGRNAKALTSADIPEPLDWIVTDVSFISLRKALPAALQLARKGAQLIALVKPQFEVGRERVGKGGVVKDPEAQAAAVADIETFLTESDWAVKGTTESPILGGDGNREFLLYAVKR